MIDAEIEVEFEELDAFVTCRNDGCDRDRWQPRVQGVLAAYCEACTHYLVREGTLPVLTRHETIRVDRGQVTSDAAVVALSGRKDGAICA